MEADVQVKDITPGTLFFTAEKLGDDKNTIEVREVFYLRDPDRECRHPHNVAVARLMTVQGELGGSEPRYIRTNDPPCRDPGEMDGRTVVNPLPGASLFGHHLPNTIEST